MSRRQRQKQAIKRAHALDKYRGKQADQERRQKVLSYRIQPIADIPNSSSL